MKAGTLCVRQTVMVKQSDSVTEAARLMRDYHVGTLIVVDDFLEKNKPLGIITDRDIAVHAVAESISMDTAVSKVMAGGLVTAREDELLYDLLEKMKSKGIRRVPVLDDEGYLAGILSIDDIVEFLSDEMKALTGIFYKEAAKEQKH